MLGLLPLLHFIGVKTSDQHPDLVGLCNGVHLASLLGHQVSRLVEVHIALACLACTCRRRVILVLLGRGLIIVWPLGALLALPAVRANDWYLDPEWKCNWRSDVGFLHSSVSIVAVFVICAGAYLLTVVKAQTTGRAARHRVLKRTQLYTLATLVTYGPFVVWSILRLNGTMTSRSILLHISWTLSELNGATNAVLYALQTRYLQRMAQRRSRVCAPVQSMQHGGASFSVDFSDNTEFLSVASAGGTSQAGQGRLEGGADLLQSVSETYNLQDPEELDEPQPHRGGPVPRWRQQMVRAENRHLHRLAAISAWQSRSNSCALQ